MSNQTTVGVSPRAPAKTALVVLSGGQDSTTCLFMAKALGYDVHAITFDYDQRHAVEIEASRKVAAMVGVLSHEVVVLGPILKGTSPLTNTSEELEQYASFNDLPGGIEKTFVPMRNQLFLTIAANRAYVLGAGVLVTGVSQADSGGYPDCRAEFIKALTSTCNLGTFTGEAGIPAPLTVLTPLMDLSKAQCVKLAMEVPGCYNALAWTHTSYDGAYPPVGQDHATLLRAKGFAEAGIPDPLILRAFYEGLMPLPETHNYDPEVVEKYLDLLTLSKEKDV